MAKIKLPLVSVILPVHNCEIFIREAVESILEQTYSSFELLIIDKITFDEFTRDVYDYEEMYLMSQCKHNIIANSSFSWWGA